MEFNLAEEGLDTGERKKNRWKIEIVVFLYFTEIDLVSFTKIESFFGINQSFLTKRHRWLYVGKKLKLSIGNF